jgi:hypothetical protein
VGSRGCVHTLSVHADYRCGNSGACCTARWRIPVDAAVEAQLTRAAADGRLTRVALERDGALAVLPLTHAGTCVFYSEPQPPLSSHPASASSRSSDPVNPAESGSPDGLERNGRSVSSGGRCAVHRALGHEALPLACRQFPRVSLVDPRGVFVTLSHFCPTAAGQLFRDDVPLEIVRTPPAFPPACEYDALDARATLPPLLHPGMLTDLAGFAAWEASAIALLADDASSAAQALDRVARVTEDVRAWRPDEGPLTDRVRMAAARVQRGCADAGRVREREYGERLSIVNACVLDGLEHRTLPPDHDRLDADLVAPAWPSFARPVRRYLATRLFGSWLAYQGRGLRTIVRSLYVALSILRVECSRACAAAGRPLDRDLLIAAVRQTDLLLVHEISSLAFARRLSMLESRSLLGLPARAQDCGQAGRTSARHSSPRRSGQCLYHGADKEDG